MKKTLMILFSIFTSSVGFAGPISSGGVPETDFQHSRAAIQTILDNDQVLSVLAHKGSIQNIALIDSQADVFAVITPECELHVKFTRVCRQTRRGLPQCDYGATVLFDESVGDCTR
jgi:hypothetical protein